MFYHAKLTTSVGWTGLLLTAQLINSRSYF